MNKLSLIIINIFLLVSTIGCSNSNTSDTSHYDLQSPESVIEAYCNAINSQDNDSLSKLITSNADIVIPYSNTKNIKIISIENDTDNTLKDLYLKNGKGSIKKPYDVICFKLNYKIKYTNGKSETNMNFVTLIKESENSPWLIDEIGK